MSVESLFIKACQRKKCERRPVWFMRQAGRYLPEYQEIRAKYTINEIINNSELASTVTLQPIQRFGFDASIIFADLLTPLQGLGFEFDFLAGEGPKIFNPIQKVEDVKNIKKFDAETHTAPTLEAIKILVAELKVPLIGFSGAPFTVSSYLLEGKSNPKLNETKKFMFKEPESWQDLQFKLVAALKNYLLAQVKAGAAALQIFDSWLGGLNVQQYKLYVKPYLEKLFRDIKSETDVPLIFFGTGLSHLSGEFIDLPVDVIGLDWRQDIVSVNELYQNKFALQGNLDPLLLFADWKLIRKEADLILRQAESVDGFIFNLGHGILPETPVENVERLVGYIREL